MKERDYWLAFSLCFGIGPKRFAQLIETFGSARDAWLASEKEIERVIGKAFTAKLIAFRPTFNNKEYQEKLHRSGVWFVTLESKEYPQLLKTSHNPPFVLFGKGNKDLLRYTRTIGIVGTRKVTSYGRQVTEMIASTLVQADYCVVSGLALGVDAVAHATTLNVKGQTIAVLGCGVDCCNPASNQYLYNLILTSGSTVVSEFPPGQSPTVGSFPSRNRIIAGLSQAVVVTEGAADSGALITARDSFINNRPVFAIPGPITSSLSSGPNELLKKGGILVTSGEDILKELNVTANPPLSRGISRLRRAKGETKEEQKIIDALQTEELSFDELIGKIVMEASELNMVLSLMEMRGAIAQSSTGNYYLVSSQ